MKNKPQDSTLPQYRCGECGESISAHTAPGFDHGWRPSKEWEEWWAKKKSGLIPL